MARKPAAPAARQSIGIRPKTELKQALEKIAAENGRSLAQEVERRLELSIDRVEPKPTDTLPGVFGDDVRAEICASAPFAHLVESAADALLQSIKAAKERGRSEIEVRTAARAALVAVADAFLWRGEDKPSKIEGALAPLGARILDYPPAALGWAIAQQRIDWLSTWRDGDAAHDRAEGRIRNLYSGDGRTVLMGPTAEQEEARRRAVAEASKAALARGDLTNEDLA